VYHYIQSDPTELRSEEAKSFFSFIKKLISSPEIFRGCLTSANLKALDEFLKNSSQVPLRSLLNQNLKSLIDPDCLMAGHETEHGQLEHKTKLGGERTVNIDGETLKFDDLYADNPEVLKQMNICTDRGWQAMLLNSES
jgi:hypothetical protein